MNKIGKLIHLIRNPRAGFGELKDRLVYALKDMRRPWDTVFLEITGHCNLSCTICGRHFTSEKLGEMPLSAFERLAAETFPLTKNLHIRGLGEPLLHKELPEIITIAKQYGVKVGISTNAMLLTGELGSRLILAGLDFLDISVDGATKQTYEMIRTGASFERVIENIKMFNTLKKSLNKKHPRLSLDPVIMKSNIAELSEFVRLAKSLGINYVCLANLVCWCEEQDRTEALYVYGDPKNFMERINEAKALAESLRMTFKIINVIPREPYRCAFNPDKHFAVAWDGTVRPCCFLFHSYTSVYRGRRLDLKPVIFGNINEERFLDIWNKPEYQEFRAKVSGREYPEACQNCLFSKNL